MLEIGKTRNAFRVARDGVSTMLTAKTKDDFEKAKISVRKRYTRHLQANNMRFFLNFALKAKGTLEDIQ